MFVIFFVLDMLGLNGLTGLICGWQFVFLFLVSGLSLAFALYVSLDDE